MTVSTVSAHFRSILDGGLKPGSFQMDLGVGYGSEELADLFGDDWLDCADRSIANNGQYTPYISEPHDVSCCFSREEERKKKKKARKDSHGSAYHCSFSLMTVICLTL